MTAGFYTFKSIKYSWKKILYQLVVTAILCTVITGILLTDASLCNRLNTNPGDFISAAVTCIESGTLFISLGFILIVVSILLLWFAVSFYLKAKENETGTLFALGFRKKSIGKLLFIETSISAVTGCIIGAFSGLAVNFFITKLLNFEWHETVQTNTLKVSFGVILRGLISTMILVETILLSGIKSHLGNPYKRVSQ